MQWCVQKHELEGRSVATNMVFGNQVVLVGGLEAAKEVIAHENAGNLIMGWTSLSKQPLCMVHGSYLDEHKQAAAMRCLMPLLDHPVICCHHYKGPKQFRPPPAAHNGPAANMA